MDALEVEIASLKARLEVAEGYSLNIALIIESNMLRKQIQTLEDLRKETLND